MTQPTQSKSFSIGQRVRYQYAPGYWLDGVILRMANEVSELYVVRFDDGREVDAFAGYELQPARDI